MENRQEEGCNKELIRSSLLSQETIEEREKQWEQLFGRIGGFSVNPEGSKFMLKMDKTDDDIEMLHKSLKIEDTIYERDYIAQAKDIDEVKFNRVMGWYLNVFKPEFVHKRSVIEMYNRDIEMIVYLLFYLSDNDNKNHNSFDLELSDIIRLIKWSFESVLHNYEYIKKEDLIDYLKYMGFQYDIARGIVGGYA